MSYSQNNRAYRAWKIEQRQKWIRRRLYNVLDDLGILLWCMVGVMVTACLLFVLCHR